jgi:DNA polymerase-3 subunit alpha
VHEQVIDAAVELKRAEAIGQFDLFGSMGEAEDAGGLRITPDIPLGEWDKAMLLAHERDMLGLYVSDHPLYGVEQFLAQSTDCSVVHVHSGDRAEGTVVTVGGLVTGVQRKTTKQGSLWAIVTLEDLDGAVEVMVFPQTYAGAGTLLVEDAVLLVRGRIDRPDEDAARLVAMEITQPDVSEAPAGPVRLSMPAARCVPPVVERLKDILAAHPGTTEVHLHLAASGRTTVLRLDDRLRVTPSPALYGDLKALLGPACLS